MKTTFPAHRLLAAPLTCGALLTAPHARAADEVAGTPAAIAVDRTTTLVVTGVLAGAWVGTELAKSALAPAGCRVCGEPNGFDDAARDALRWGRPDGAATLSDVSAFALVPAVAVATLAFTRDDDAHFFDDLLIVGEATAASGALVQLVKFTVGRERPFVTALPAEEKARTAAPADNDLSFYSGHTAVTLALGTSVATLATLRGHRAAPWLWTASVVAGLGTGYLRVAADKHYATDVLTGALMGTALGVTVPLLHVEGENVARVVPTLAAGPGSLALSWRLP